MCLEAGIDFMSTSHALPSVPGEPSPQTRSVADFFFHGWQHLIDEMRRTLGHTPAAAARAEAAPLAGKRHQPPGVAIVALKARESAPPCAAGQEVAELLLDERGQAVLTVLRSAEKRGEVLAHQPVEHRVLAGAGAVRVSWRGCRRGRGDHAERHG